MTSLSPCSDFSAATAGASRLHADHHGAQNHSRTSFPAVAARSNCCPSSCGPASSRISARVSTGAGAAVAAGAAAALVPVPPAVVAGVRASRCRGRRFPRHADLNAAAADQNAEACQSAHERNGRSGPRMRHLADAICDPASRCRARAAAWPPCPALAGDSAGYIRPGEHPSADCFGSRHRVGHPDGVRGPGAHRAVALPGSGRRVNPVRTGRKRGVPSSRDGR